MTEPVMRRVVEQCRVVVDNDYAGDPDGLVGLAHHLLSPTNRVTTVTSSFLNPRFAESDTTAAEGARLAAALEDDALPSFVVCGGPLTNVAGALEQEPAIATRMTLVWIGGSLALDA